MKVMASSTFDGHISGNSVTKKAKIYKVLSSGLITARGTTLTWPPRPIDGF